MGEFGLVASQGVEHARRLLNEVLDREREAGKKPTKWLTLLEDLRAEWHEWDARIHTLDQALEEESKNNEVCRRLLGITGVGPLGVSIIAATIGHIALFKNARQFAAFLGLTPRERQSGTHRVMGGLTKRGNTYIRNLMIHGARAALWHLTKPEAKGRLSEWLKAMLERRGYNVTVCALANKNARIIWAMLTRGTAYQPAR